MSLARPPALKEKLEKIIFSSPSEVKQDDINLMISLILEANEDSREREFPDYISFVINSPRFKIYLYSADTQVPWAGKYAPLKNAMGLILPATKEDQKNCVKQVIPHEFWHAYQTTLQAKGHNPATMLNDASDFNCAELQAPYKGPNEEKEFLHSIDQGLKRIQHFKRLMDIPEKTLTSQQKEQLKTYQWAASDYFPMIHHITHTLKRFNLTDKDYKKLSSFDFKKQQPNFILDNGMPLYLTGCSRQGQDVTLMGFLVSSPESSEGRQRALIADTHFRETIILKSEMYSEQARGVGQLLVYLTEVDAFIATNSKKLNEVFFPERHAHHHKMRMKILGKLLFDVSRNRFSETELQQNIYRRNTRSLLFSSMPPLEWKQVSEEWENKANSFVSRPS